MRRAVAILAAAAAFLAASLARAQSLPASQPASSPASLPAYVHFGSGFEARGKGWLVELPAGYFLDEQKYKALDGELVRLQTAETRLIAENETLKSFEPGRLTVKLALILLGVGFAAGASAGFFLAR